MQRARVATIAVMDYGICLPNYPSGASPDGVEAAAATAEALGWSTVWTTDHVVVDRENAEGYGRIFDAILTLAWVGARHPSVRLGTSVIVVPQRNAVLLAKELASLDVLSGGRVVAGVGVGWNETEFASLGAAERFSSRGAYLDEAIRLWRHLWSGSEAAFVGRYHRLEDFVFDPLPVQGEQLPIWIGGRSPAALRRAATLGDGWQSTAIGPAAFAERVAAIREVADAVERAMPALGARVRVRFDETDGQGYALRGDPAAIAEEVRGFASAGAGHLALSFPSTDPDGVVREMERFAREVVPLVG
jgi:probable F420-dependent oxidoreductase